jgi:hypothetical protein
VHGAAAGWLRLNALASTNKSLAQTNKSWDGVGATKRCQPEGRSNSHHRRVKRLRSIPTRGPITGHPPHGLRIGPLFIRPPTVSAPPG